MKINLTLFFICFQAVLFSQTLTPLMKDGYCINCPANTQPVPNTSKKGGNASVFDGNESINTSYTASACGLNYISANFPLFQRGFSLPAGVTQPAPFLVSGIPLCGKIFKAFLYSSCEGGAAAPALSANIQNPIGASSNFPMAVIGTGTTKCWGSAGYTNSYAYRADITSIISGNGTYFLSGLPVSPSGTDVNGATLFIIYTDESQNYTGSIVLADGMMTSVTVSPLQTTISGFNICGTPTLSTNFMILDDLQQVTDANVALNDAVPNYVELQANQAPWQFINAAGTAPVNGQTSANYSANAGGDCIGMILAGLYCRTGCLTCPNPLTLTATSSSCTPTGSANVVAIGGVAPLSYTWSGSAATTASVTGLAAGTHTVRVADAFSCKTRTTTINITRPSTITVNNATICPAINTTLTAGATSSYTWSPGATLNTTSGASVIANPTITTIYTVNTTNSLSCISTSTAQVFVYPTPTITLPNRSVCIGNTVTLTAVGPMVSYTWSPPGGLSGTSGPTVAANPLITSTYNVAFTNSLTCISSKTMQLLVTPTETISAPDFTNCAGQTISLTANSYTSVGNGYYWTGPLGYNSVGVPTPTIPNATVPMSGTYNFSLTSVPGCTSMAVSNVTVFSLPSPTITSNTPVCTNTSLTLLGSGANSYTWSGPAAFGSTATNTNIANASTANSGLYTLTAAFVNGCQATITRSLQVKPLPVPVIGYNSPLCAGGTLSLTAGGGGTYSWTGPNSFTSSAQNPTIINIAANGAGTYTVLVSLVSCTATTNTLVVVNPLPIPTATNNSPVCETKSVQLTGAGGVGYSWVGPTSYTSILQNPVIAVSQATNNGTYTLTVTDGIGCQASTVTTMSIMVNPSIIATGTNVCFGSPGTLTVVGGTGYSWIGPNGFTSVVQNPTIAVVNAASSAFYTVTVNGANTCTTVTTASLGTIPRPVIVPTPTNACFGEAAILTATGASTYSWTGPNSYAANGGTVTVPVTNTASIGTYTIIGTGANTCVDTFYVNLGFIPLPTVTASGANVCLKEPALLTSTGTFVSSYFWNGPPSYTANTQNATIISATNVPVRIYTVVATAPNSCTSAATASLFTIPLPTVTATGTLICLNEPFTMVASGATSYSWTGPNNFSLPNSPTASVIVDGTTSGNYVILGLVAATGCTNTGVTQLSTLPLPTITPVSSTVCYGKPTTLQASGGVSYGYTWRGPDNYSSNTAIAFIPVTNTLSAGIYTVVGTAPNTCTQVAYATLGYHLLPLPAINAPLRVCFKSSMTLQGSGAKTYTWTGPYNYSSVKQNVVIPIFDTRQGGTYTLTVTDTLGCVNFTTALVKIDPLPNGKLNSNNANGFCVPFCSKFKLQNTGITPIVNATWLVNNRVFPGDTFSYCIAKANDNFVIGTFTDAIGCMNTVTFAINAFPKPAADYVYTPDKPAESLDIVSFKNASEGDKQVQWDWYFVNNKGYISSSKNTSYIFNDAGSYEVAMVVTNTWGCADTVVKTIVISADIKLYIPNAFTPNSDGLNDTFQPKGRGIQKYNLTVFDRWSNIIFQSNDFDKGWDGTLKGSRCTDDVYIWKINGIDANGKVVDETGYVTLTR